MNSGSTPETIHQALVYVTRRSPVFFRPCFQTAVLPATQPRAQRFQETGIAGARFSLVWKWGTAREQTRRTGRPSICALQGDREETGPRKQGLSLHKAR